MTFIYPAVLTPHQQDEGFHAYFPDLECCEADGPDLEDTIEAAREAAYNWIQVELDDTGELPGTTPHEEIALPEGGFVRDIMVRIKLLPDYD